MRVHSVLVLLDVEVVLRSDVADALRGVGVAEVINDQSVLVLVLN